MLSGVHATAGRQVSTWAHAVIAGKANVVGFTSHSVILPEFTGIGGRLNRFCLCVCICIPMHNEGNPHGKVVRSVHSSIWESEPETSVIDLCIVSWSRILNSVGKPVV
jgi:hypothetical protein